MQNNSHPNYTTFLTFVVSLSNSLALVASHSSTATNNATVLPPLNVNKLCDPFAAIIILLAVQPKLFSYLNSYNYDHCN